MRYSRILLLAALLSSGLLQAQELFTGTRLSIGQSQFTQVKNSDPLIYLEAGGVASYKYLPWLDLNAEALLAWQGGGYSGVQEVDGTLGFTSEQPFDGQIRSLALKIPLYPAINVGSENFRFRLQAGPNLSFNFFARESRDYESDNVEDTRFEDFETYDPLTFSMLYGAGISIRTDSGKLFYLDFRYNNGLSDFVNLEFIESPRDARLDYWTISMVYMMGE